MTSTTSTTRKPKTPARTTKATKAPAKVTPRKSAADFPTVKLTEGVYAVRWPHGSYDLLQKIEGKTESSPKWLVRCTAHQTTTPADAAKDGDAKGRKADRITWCKSCKAEATKVNRKSGK